jgi:hypothetical protein
MQDIQGIFNRIQENKKKLKDLKQAYKDALSTSQAYEEATETLKTMKEKKKAIETATKEQFSGEFTQMEDLKIDIESDNEMISDIALTTMMKGETVQITDQYDNEYEPQFTVKFKKIK